MNYATDLKVSSVEPSELDFFFSPVLPLKAPLMQYRCCSLNHLFDKTHHHVLWERLKVTFWLDDGVTHFNVCSSA